MFRLACSSAVDISRIATEEKAARLAPRGSGTQR
jgi:hypothetical protein